MTDKMPERIWAHYADIDNHNTHVLVVDEAKCVPCSKPYIPYDPDTIIIKREVLEGLIDRPTVYKKGSVHEAEMLADRKRTINAMLEMGE